MLCYSIDDKSSGFPMSNSCCEQIVYPRGREVVEATTIILDERIREDVCLSSLRPGKFRTLTENCTDDARKDVDDVLDIRASYKNIAALFLADDSGKALRAIPEHNMPTSPSKTRLIARPIKKQANRALTRRYNRKR